MNYEFGIPLRLSGVFTWQPQFCQVKNTWQAQRELGILRLSGVFTWQPQFCQLKNTWQAQREFGI